MAKTRFPKTQRGLIPFRKKMKNFDTQYVPIIDLPLNINEFCENVLISLRELNKTLKQCKGILGEIRNQQKVDK